jgi:hypothetical protein
MLVFSVVITIFIVAILGFFSLNYVRFIGSHIEQRNAIEAAALAAARDLSMIAINTNEYGWISLSDAAPIGNITTVGDGYNIPVRSINSILGTLRLDLIIAGQLGDANLKTIIKADVAKAKAAQAVLATELTKSLVSGYSAKDINGNPVNVYADAENAYKANKIRMSGSSNYINNSLKLSIGGIINGAPTNTPLPKPGRLANVPADRAQNDFYLSYKDIPADGESFVFAGISDSIKLIEPKQWIPIVPGLPYQVATVIKAEADQHLTDSLNPNGYDIHGIACAQPANVADPRPSPGALTFSFPDGIPPEIVNPMSLLTYAPLNGADNCTFQTSLNGDYPIGIPTTQIKDLSWPYLSLSQNTGNVFRVALFDWWKRGGTKLNVSSAVNMFTDSKFNFVQPGADVMWKARPTPSWPISLALPFGLIPAGNVHIYKVDPSSGSVTYQNKPLNLLNLTVAGENQMYSESINAFKTTLPTRVLSPLGIGPIFSLLGIKNITMDRDFDIYIRDQVYQPGSIKGGRHGGEPMDFPLVAVSQMPANLSQSRDLGGPGFGASSPPLMPPAITNQSDFAETSGFGSSNYNQYTQGPSASGNPKMRPTYQKNGMAVDIRFRRQISNGFASSLFGFKTGYIGERLP